MREEIFANHISNKQLVSRIYKKHLKFNNERINNPILKRTKELERLNQRGYMKRLYEWKMST